MCTTDLRRLSIEKMYHIDPKKNWTLMLLDQLRDNNYNNSNSNNNNNNNSKGASSPLCP